MNINYNIYPYNCMYNLSICTHINVCITKKIYDYITTQISTRIIASIPKYKCSYTYTITLFL